MVVGAPAEVKGHPLIWRKVRSGELGAVGSPRGTEDVLACDKITGVARRPVKNAGMPKGEVDRPIPTAAQARDTAVDSPECPVLAVDERHHLLDEPRLHRAGGVVTPLGILASRSVAIGRHADQWRDRPLGDQLIEHTLKLATTAQPVLGR